MILKIHRWSVLYNSNIFKNLLFNIKALMEWDFKIIILQWLYVISSIHRNICCHKVASGINFLPTREGNYA